MEWNRKKWEEIGVLVGIPEYRKDIVAYAMTVAFNWIEQNMSGCQHEVLPIEVVNRIARTIDLTDEQILEICKEVHPAHDGYDFNKFNYVGGNTIDYEAEFVGEFCDKKIEQLKNR